MANNNSNYDYETLRHLRTLVSIDYVRVTNYIRETDDEDKKRIYLVDESDDEGKKRIYPVDESDDEEKSVISDEEKEKDGIEGKCEPRYFGTVIVTDCLGDEVVYNQYNHEKAEELPMTLPKEISLYGPRREISGSDTFVISVNFSVFLRPFVTDDIVKEIGRGEIVFDPDTRDPSSYDKPLQHHVFGKYGTVTVGYSVIREALSATIDVVWMRPSEQKIFGTVKAVGPSTTRMLFHRSRTAGAQTCPRASIFKQKFPFPVPIHSPLTIEVDLWWFRSYSAPDFQSVLGIAEFTPRLGRQETIISGKYGRVQVSITCE